MLGEETPPSSPTAEHNRELLSEADRAKSSRWFTKLENQVPSYSNVVNELTMHPLYTQQRIRIDNEGLEQESEEDVMKQLPSLPAIEKLEEEVQLTQRKTIKTLRISGANPVVPAVQITKACLNDFHLKVKKQKLQLVY